MRRDAEPAAALLCPDVGVAALLGSAVGQVVVSGGVDDGGIVEQADLDVPGPDVRDGDRPGRLNQEAGAVDDGAVRVAAAEVRGQILVEPRYVRFLHRANVVAVQFLERLALGVNGGVGLHWFSSF